MELTGKDLIFASLMGSNAVGAIERVNLVQNELSKRVLPRIPFLPIQNEDIIATSTVNPSWQLNQADAVTPEEKQFFPLSFSFTENGQKWLFPYEPMINISSGNNIIKRNVAKQRENQIGTIKSRWSRKDFDISVTGVLMGSLLSGSVEDCFPTKKMQELMQYLVYAKEIYVYCHPLFVVGITKVIVEDYSFPFTKGENVQAYDLKLLSDFSYNLLIKEEF